MLKAIRKHTQTIVVAAITAAVTAGVPAVAHGVNHALFAHNSDKVDGKHAVGSGATPNQRKGKLVATNNNTGQLPNNIIAKAADSELLDGIDSAGFYGVGSKVADSELLDGQDSSAFLRGAQIYRIYGDYTQGVADTRTGGRKASIDCDPGDVAVDGGYYTGSVNNPNFVMGSNTYFGSTFMVEWWVPGGGASGYYALLVTCLDTAAPAHGPGRSSPPGMPAAMQR